jgi:hypothetical protein
MTPERLRKRAETIARMHEASKAIMPIIAASIDKDYNKDVPFTTPKSSKWSKYTNVMKDHMDMFEAIKTLPVIPDKKSKPEYTKAIKAYNKSENPNKTVNTFWDKVINLFNT